MRVKFGLVCLWLAVSPHRSFADQQTFTLTLDRFDERPCEVYFEEVTPKLMISLVESRGDWAARFHLSSAPKNFETFFDSRGLRDEEKVNAATKSVFVGGSEFPVHDATLLVIQKTDLDRAALIVSINALHNVAALVTAMSADRLEVGEVAVYTDMENGLKAFRTCAIEALDLEDGNIPPFDHVAELRLLFEGAFATWVGLRSQADGCGMASSDGVIAAMIDAAGAAFYPGFAKAKYRVEWKDSMTLDAQIAMVGGLTSAARGECSALVKVTEAAYKNVLDDTIENAVR